MSQEQKRRPEAGKGPIKYGDVFPVTGELAKKAIAPGDAALMQSAETEVLGYNKKGGPVSMMRSAADKNESAGLVGHDEVTDLARDQGVAAERRVEAGRRVVTESVAGQVIGETPSARGPYKIGEALEATSIAVGDKPIDQSDATAIKVAEMRATGDNVLTPGGIGEAAQSAADMNPKMTREEDKTKLSDVLTDATKVLPWDKIATEADAEAVKNAEIRNKPDGTIYSGGVADTMSAAARLNQQQKQKQKQSA